MGKSQPYYILNGAGREWDDFGFLTKLAKTGGTFSGWGCSKAVRKGDPVFFYITAPRSAIVAQGTAMKDAWKGTSKDNWRFNTEVGEIRFLANQITISEIKILFPAWSKWYHPQGQGWQVPEEFVKGLLARVNQSTSDIQPSSTSTKGAGFGAPESNRKVEIAAVRAVTKWFKNKGWAVKSVEPEKVGYDLLVVKGTQTKHIEVKGVAGEAPVFIITQNELARATSDNGFVLAVVTNALSSTQRKIHRLQGRKFLTEYDFKPVSFWAIAKS